MFSLVYRMHFSFRTQLWNSGRQECLIRKSFSFLEFARCQIWKNTRRQECYSETIDNLRPLIKSTVRLKAEKTRVCRLSAPVRFYFVRPI
jgi:hypothetical protein